MTDTPNQTAAMTDDEILEAAERIKRRSEGNARLMAAAPDLLASLQEIVNEWGFPNTPKWHRAKASIEKATGGKRLP